MLLLIYFKIIVLLVILFLCGLILFKRATSERRAQILIPSGMLLGIALYIFFVNLFAHFLKGPGGFYAALIAEILLALTVKKRIKESPLIFPAGREKIIWLISLSVWAVFFYLVTATGHASSGDVTHQYILASFFSRGNYPILSPYQPDFSAYYHIGGVELLGASRSFTGASYELLFSLFSFISFLSISQILSFLIKTAYDKFRTLILYFMVPAVGLISLGGFMLVWPYQLASPVISEDIIKWLGNLPVFGAFGASTSLDNFSLFFHRVLSLAFFIALLPVILYPKIKSYILPGAVLVIALAAIALTDESVFIIIALPLFIIAFFSIFKGSVIKCIFFGLLALAIVIIQGGIITESIFNKNGSYQAVLIFPPDETGPMAYYHNYRSYRFQRMKSDLFPDKEHYIPFRWLHPGIFWQLGLMLFLSLLSYFLYRKKEKPFVYLLWLLFLSSVSSVIAYNALIPKGMFHLNGNRFLGLSYHLSGLGIAFFILFWWINTETNVFKLKIIYFISKAAIIWLLIVSIIPSLAHTFPLQKYNWFFYNPPADLPIYSWIKNNIPGEKRFIVLTEPKPVATANLQLARQTGAYVALWTPQIHSQGFDVNPPYSDIFYTINPELLKILKVDYLIISNQYLSNIPKKRVADLQNPKFFRIAYIDDLAGTRILEILPKYLSEGENYKGTFYELTQMAPKKGSYFIERVPNIPEDMYRVARLALVDREVYYNVNDPFYNFIINIDLKYYGIREGGFDYLILNEKTDPQKICSCNAKLLWEGLGNGIKVWQVL